MPRIEGRAGTKSTVESGVLKKLLLFSFLVAHCLWAQDRPIDPTWLHRYVPDLGETKAELTSPSCHYLPMFGESDKDNRSLQTVTRLGEVTLDAHGSCQTVRYDRQEEIYFVLDGGGLLHYEDEVQGLRTHDFTYLPPGVKHSLSNNSDQPVRRFRMPRSQTCRMPERRLSVVIRTRSCTSFWPDYIRASAT
jgi:mannose-6-phosphate isomerase-like protein (cupin superfamily)